MTAINGHYIYVHPLLRSEMGQQSAFTFNSDYLLFRRLQLNEYLRYEVLGEKVEKEREVFLLRSNGMLNKDSS